MITSAQYADQLRKQIELLEKVNRPFTLAVKSTHAAISERVFTDGYNEKGEQFQYNSTKPVYIDPDKSPVKVTQKGKTGKPTKTAYFESYKAYRDAIGRETRFVDWELSGDLKSDYENQPVGTPSSTAEPIRISVNEYAGGLRSGENLPKYRSLVRRFGNFLTANKKEETNFYEICEKELALILEP